jgi:sugar O-acyltransferase (sialic acid O-acetyltransferase NeuD family)
VNKISIYGASGFGREVAWLAEACAADGTSIQVACFIDDDAAKHGISLNDIPIMGLEEARRRFPDALVVAGVGVPAVRERLMDKAAAGGFSFKTLIHPRVEISRWIEIGEGTVICAGNILTTNIKLGQHVQINLDCTIGHDVIMGDYATLAPGVHVSGCVHIGKRAYIGTGAVIINGTQDNPLVIGDDAIVGAGACVTKSIPSGQTWGGVPAKLLKSSQVNTLPGGATT